MTLTARQVKAELQNIADPIKGRFLQRFFKTGKGEYAEGDIFLGIPVPAQRVVAKKFRSLPLSEIQKLLKSRIHEHRFTALEILVDQSERANESEKKIAANFYLKNTRYINNWDLVDTSALYILGPVMINSNKATLLKLARSNLVWERRIAVLTTFYFISKGQFITSLKLAKMLMNDSHDLIHKAVGWMLREIGKRDREAETKFLNQYAKQMPRTMLRYAIEHYPPSARKKFMQ